MLHKRDYSMPISYLTRAGLKYEAAYAIGQFTGLVSVGMVGSYILDPIDPEFLLYVLAAAMISKSLLDSAAILRTSTRFGIDDLLEDIE
jgi:hypothetical protein